MADILVGTEIASESDPKTQVYRATHIEGEERKRSSLMSRSFISFSYGGKFIEDFDLIAITSGDRLQKNLYANFEDDITDYVVIDGQYHWGTHFTNNTFNFVLATDGITEKKLNEFKHWFKPGIERELILAENPNRGIMARVAAPPAYSVLPFEEKIKTTIAGEIYDTSTTLYKGEINLSLVADEPFWYSRNIFIDYYYDSNVDDKFNPNNFYHSFADNLTETLKDKDILKVIVEDNIPYIDMINAEMILPEGRYAKLIDADANESSIIGEESDESVARIGDTLLQYNGVIGIVYGDTITISKDSPKYLYYGGTAPSKPIIQFSLTPQIKDDYIAVPYNTYAPGPNGEKYNIFTIGSQSMKFTLPSFWLGYNQAVAIIKNQCQEGDLSEEIRQKLITGIHEYYSRSWALASFQVANRNNDIIQSNFYENFLSSMWNFLSANTSNILSADFVFDSHTGVATGVFQVLDANAITDISQTDISALESHVFSVGDMLRSPFIIIEDMNTPADDNYIRQNNCNVVSTDYPILDNVTITYKNMYY